MNIIELYQQARVLTSINRSSYTQIARYKADQEKIRNRRRRVEVLLQCFDDNDYITFEKSGCSVTATALIVNLRAAPFELWPIIEGALVAELRRRIK